MAITTEEDPFEKEQEILPGIYLSKLKKSGEPIQQSLQTRIHQLEQQVDRLRYSNSEIQKQMEIDKDPVYEECLKENLIVIEKKEKELADLRPKPVDTDIVLDENIPGHFL